MKVGDNVICKKSSKVFVKNKSYKIIKIDYGLNGIINNDKSTISHYVIESVTSFNVIFTTSEMEEFFYSLKDLRKEKLQQLFK